MTRIYQRKAIDMAGQRIGRLLVVSYVRCNDYGVAVWLCRCDCGTDVEVPRRSLVHPKTPTRSCGCLRREVSSKRMIARRRKDATTP